MEELQGHLYFVCPTDNMETLVNNNFDQDNYYVTSLGNSIPFDMSLIEEISALIEVKRIRNITFVLSNENRLLIDAIEHQTYTGLQGLDDFYSLIGRYTKDFTKMWRTNDLHTQVLSFYLDMKTNELRSKLNSWLANELTIDAKIYDTQSHIFNNISVNRHQLQPFNLN